VCPKFNNGICEIVGMEPDYVECADESCYKNSREYEACRFYMLELVLCCDDLSNAAKDLT